MRGGIVLFVNSFSVYSKIRIIRKSPYLFPGRNSDIDKMILLLSLSFFKKISFWKLWNISDTLAEQTALYLIPSTINRTLTLQLRLLTNFAPHSFLPPQNRHTLQLKQIAILNVVFSILHIFKCFPWNLAWFFFAFFTLVQEKYQVSEFPRERGRRPGLWEREDFQS